jgi:RND family efflux transporter MFP subunit
LLLLLGSSAWADTARVTTVALEDVAQTPTYSVPATVVARNTPSISAEIAAAVTEIPVLVGDRVEQGALLARLDCRRYEAQRDSAESALAQAKANRSFSSRQLGRTEDLRRKNSISEELLDQRQTELAANRTLEQGAAAALSQATIDVDACVLRAPLDAVVTATHASVGDYVAPGMPVVALSATSDQEVSVSLRADQVESFNKAPSRYFEYGGQVLALELRTIIPVFDSISRTREARLTFRSTSAMPGTPGRVTWRGQQSQVPAEFLLRRDQQIGVFILAQDKAKFIALPDAEEGRPAELSLPPGTRLIDEGRQRLADGDRVDAVNDSDTPQ